MALYDGISTILREDYPCTTCNAKRGDYCLTKNKRETSPHESRWEQYRLDPRRRFARDLSPWRQARFRERDQTDRASEASLLDQLTQPKPGFAPQRDDSVAEWLKRSRDKCVKHSQQWFDVDQLLDDYRLHADTGTPLEFDVHESDIGG